MNNSFSKVFPFLKMIRVRSASPPADGGRHVFAAGGRRRAPRVGMPRSPASPPPKRSTRDLSLPFFVLHAVDQRRRRRVPRRRGGTTSRAGAADPGRFLPPSIKVHCPHPPTNALLPSGAPARAALGRRIQRLAHRSSNHDRIEIDFTILLHFGC
jgi:hypothetical protein